MRTIVPSRWVTGRPVLMGSLAAGLAAACYGTSQFLGRKLVTEMAPPLVVATFTTMAGMLILGAISYQGLVQDRRAPRHAFLLMILAGLAATAGVTFNLFALKLAPVVIVAPVSAANPLISLGLAHLFLKRLERVTLRIWIGAVMVVAGVIFVTLGTM